MLNARADLEPAVTEQQLAESMPVEQIGPHPFFELVACDVVSDVSEAEASGDIGMPPLRR